MMKFTLITLVLFLSGCASVPSAHYSNTMNIIHDAAAQAPDGVDGEFRLHIKASGTQYRTVYLNTEEDYRDQRCVTVAIPHDVAQQLAQRYGQSPTEFFIDKDIAVKGEAKRATIVFLSQGKATKGYYYQTHIRITDPDQIEVL